MSKKYIIVCATATTIGILVAIAATRCCSFQLRSHIYPTANKLTAFGYVAAAATTSTTFSELRCFCEAEPTHARTLIPFIQQCGRAST